MPEKRNAPSATDGDGCQSIVYRNHVSLVGCVAKRGTLTVLPAKRCPYCEIQLKVSVQEFTIAGFGEVAKLLANAKNGDWLEVEGSLVIREWGAANKEKRTRAVIDASRVANGTGGTDESLR